MHTRRHIVRRLYYTSTQPDKFRGGVGFGGSDVAKVGVTIELEGMFMHF